ncbi:MAG: hypothetical protein CME19_08110 [Gemmatimonadetes bacterium]|nr:hypothetical protein [Gemmatimonadota bacterium]
MKKWLSNVAVACLSLATTSHASTVIDGEGDDDISPIGPTKAGRLEINPIVSFRMSGGNMIYQFGASLAYSLTRHHQLGGTFVMGNRLYSRTNQRQAVVQN